MLESSRSTLDMKGTSTPGPVGTVYSSSSATEVCNLAAPVHRLLQLDPLLTLTDLVG